MPKTKITHALLSNGKHRYIAPDGEVLLKASARTYTHASVYRVDEPGDYTMDGHYDPDRDKSAEIGRLVFFLHGRRDLAAKGNPDANRVSGWTKLPQVVEVVDA